MTWIIQPVVYPSICITPLHIFFSPQAICRFFTSLSIAAAAPVLGEAEKQHGAGMVCPCPMRGTLIQRFSSFCRFFSRFYSARSSTLFSTSEPSATGLATALALTSASGALFSLTSSPPWAGCYGVLLVLYCETSMCRTTTTVSVAWKPIESPRLIVTVNGTA